MKDRSNQILEAEECLDIVHKKLNQNSMNDFSLIKYEIVPVQQTNGYLGQYFYLKVSVARPESPTDRRNIKFFIKMRPPKGTKQYDIVCNSGMFNREVRLYTRIFPAILNHSDRDYIPVCYLGLENDVLVLEDMISKGYRVFPDKLKVLDVEHCRLVMRILGKYHARSIIFEERNKKGLMEFCREKKIVIRSYDEAPPSVFTTGVKCALSVIDCLIEFDSTTRDKFKALVNEIQSEMHKMLVPSSKYRNVQLHGDLWTNNLLFKYNADNLPEQCCFIDFQNTRYAPAAYDILVFLFYTTTKEMRDEHSENLYKIYYESFEKSLKAENIEVSKILPWNAFMESINEFKVFGLLRAIIALPIILSNMQKMGQETQSQLWSNVCDETFVFYSNQCKKNEHFKTRMLDIFSELQQFSHQFDHGESIL